MKNNNAIPIQNIFYMLSYAFKELKHNNYGHIAGETFEDIHDLFAEILYLGVAFLLKQGLHKEYIIHEEVTPTLRGKLNLPATLLERMACKTQLCCEYDELSENNLYNQILKTALILLMKHPTVKKSRKRKLRNLILFFQSVEDRSLADIRWNTLRYDQNTRTYQMLHNLCFFLFQHQLPSTEGGQAEAPLFTDKQMHQLFQRFVLEYFKRHHPHCKAAAPKVKWDVEDNEGSCIKMLPSMQTDLMLTVKERTLIIDTKYYSKNIQVHYDKETVLSVNLYQIQSYVLNEDSHRASKGRVDGMLLYAHTGNEKQPHLHFKNSAGNLFMVRTLNLNQEFEAIKKELDQLLDYYS